LESSDEVAQRLEQADLAIGEEGIVPQGEHE